MTFYMSAHYTEKIDFYIYFILFINQGLILISLERSANYYKNEHDYVNRVVLSAIARHFIFKFVFYRPKFIIH